MKSFLLIVDVQNGFINHNTEKVIENIKKCRDVLNYDVCIFSKFVNNRDTSFSRILNWDRLSSQAEQELVLPIGSDDLIVEKSTYSALTSELKSYLINGGFSNAYICGMDTDSCVLATAFDLFDLGINPTIITDCCASSRGEEFNEAAQMIMKRTFGANNIRTLSECIDKAR